MYQDWIDWIDAHKDDQGIDFTKLNPGTRVKVDTMFSTYEFTVLEDRRTLVKGGEHFQEEKIGHLSGSTWGGSSIKLNWIGYDMHMEIIFQTDEKTKIVKTSKVKAATVYGDGWEYILDWPSPCDPQ